MLGLLLFHVLPVRCFANKALPLELRLLLQHAGAVRFVSKCCAKQHAARHAHVGRLPLIDTPLRVLDLELQFVLLLLQFHGRSLDKEVLLDKGALAKE